MQQIQFDVLQFELQGKKMIEASAGTGKTFSVAILVVRLLVETETDIKSILMMTFTKAAAAEMEERIRLFIREAFSYLEDGHDVNDTLKSLLDDIADTDEKKIIILEKLKRAILDLDQMSVSTIHSFCSNILTEYAFETGQLYGVEPLEDLTLLIQGYVNEFWRLNVATLNPMILAELIDLKYNRDSIVKVIQDVLSGKRYVPYIAGNNYDLTIQDNMTASEHIEAHFDQITVTVNAMRGGVAKTNLLLLIENNNFQEIAEFLIFVNKKSTSARPDYIDDFSYIMNDLFHIELIQKINCNAINDILEKIKDHMLSNNNISFDDMIVKMEAAITLPTGGAIISALSNKYKAVFIDEFQDTDKSQYNIFKNVFIKNNHETFVCLIGDPKQMIYAWRKADMGTYIAAKADMDLINGDQAVYFMKENFRSSYKYIDAMNLFFTAFPPNFETFNMSGEVEYQNINFPQIGARTLNEITDADTESGLLPMNIEMYQAKPDMNKRFMRDIQGLLKGNTTIRIPDPKEPSSYRKVRASDIGVLVRTKKQANSIKKLLSKYGIPAVKIDDANIFETIEAEQILYLLEAFNERTPNKIKRALLATFINIQSNTIVNIDTDIITEKFKTYNDIFEKKGVYHALKSFFTGFNIQHYLLFEFGIGGERVYANLIQVAESLHQIEHEKKLAATDLKIWLRKMIAQQENIKTSEYEQRIESDENAVKIVTIHKSKGLEYNIVFAPFLDLKPFPKGNSSFRDENDEFCFIEHDYLNNVQEGLFESQNEEENKRLIYVAITRAKYRSYVYATTNTRYMGTISSFISKITQNQQEDIDGLIKIVRLDPEYTENLRYPIRSFYRDIQETIAPSPKEFLGDFPIDNWWKMSYSRLASKNHEIKEFTKPDQITDAFDKFVFEQFPKGAKAGNILHTILEKIDFTTNDDGNWDIEIDSALNFYRVKGNLESLKSNIKLWLEHILNTNILMPDGVTLKLSEVKHEDRINELEFDFNMNEFDAISVANVVGETEVRINTELFKIKGVMNGKMDLFFRHNGKYYILDWKSNFLGFTLDDYQKANVEEAMTDSNYHLQYLIYTMASRLYLKNRIPDFNYDDHFGGVVYLFLRGIRNVENSGGIFTEKPTVEVLDRLENLIHCQHH
jgi:exodeoxyribonuclease V beta subunit